MCESGAFTRKPPSDPGKDPPVPRLLLGTSSVRDGTHAGSYACRPTTDSRICV